MLDERNSLDPSDFLMKSENKHFVPLDNKQQPTGSFASAGGDEYILIVSATSSYISG